MLICYVPGGIIIICNYLYDGEGLSLRNWNILLCIAEFIQTLRIPWILTGDFNLFPETLEGSMWPCLVGGRVACSGEATCHNRGSGTQLDYCVLQQELFALALSCQRSVMAPLKVHDVVVIDLLGAPASHWSRGTPSSFRRGLLPQVRPRILSDGFRTWPWKRSTARLDLTGCLLPGHMRRTSSPRLFRFHWGREVGIWAELVMGRFPRQSLCEIGGGNRRWRKFPNSPP